MILSRRITQELNTTSLKTCIGIDLHILVVHLFERWSEETEGELNDVEQFKSNIRHKQIHLGICIIDGKPQDVP